MPAAAPPMAPLGRRLRLAAISATLAVLMVVQDTGKVATDTKIDLVVDPWRFLGQSLSMWDPLGEGGRMQNQAYGYLFPMGPFFGVFHSLGMPGWFTQRLWESSLLVAGFLGIYLVCRAIGVVRFWPAVAAGLVFSLTPRILSELTFNSAELLPTMVAPWILLPLIHAGGRWTPRRAAAFSGVALLAAGGTNAGATLAVMTIPVLWLLTRRWDRAVRVLASWCVVCWTLVSVWWLVPLLVLGRYSPPFLDWIEAAENTTVSTSLLAALRGVPHWVAYLGPTYWPAGWDYVATPALIVATTAVAAAGLVGLSRSDMPHRLFFCCCLAVGLVGVTLGHDSTVGPVVAGPVRSLLDGPLVAVRNVHKFQGLITLPLATGVGVMFDRLRSTAVAAPRQSRQAWRIAGLAGAFLVGAISIAPALDRGLVSAARDETVAPWWDGAADWLAANGTGARALIVPGAPFPTHLWGETIDEPIQPVADSPWVVRSAVPLAEAGLIRLLDVVEGRLSRGVADDSLAPLLDRSGIEFVVIRHDLDASASAAVPQSLVRSTLRASSGFELAARLGPRIGESTGRGYVVDGGAGGARPAIEIYRVAGVAGAVALLPASGAVRANGSADVLSALTDAGLPAATPVLFGTDGDVGALAGVQELDVLTDGIRRQQDAFGGPFRRSPTLAESEEFAGERPAFDYLPSDPVALSEFRYAGIAGVEASSSGADIRAVYSAAATLGPWSAVDGSMETAWHSAAWGGAAGEWLELTFTEAIEIGSFDIAFADDVLPFPARLEVTTDTGSVLVDVDPSPVVQTVSLPAPSTTARMRVTVPDLDRGVLGSTVGIAELRVPGVDPQRSLVVPGTGSPTLMRFAAAAGYRSGCLDVGGGVFCDAAWSSRGEEDEVLDRTFTLSEPTAYEVSATVRLRPGTVLDALLDADEAMLAAASPSSSVPDPRIRPGAAVDGDESTTWVALPGDPDRDAAGADGLVSVDPPFLTIDLPHVQAVRAVRLATNPGAPVARPTVVWISAGDQDWIGEVPSSGLIRLPEPARTDSITITIAETEDRFSISTVDGLERPLPPGISEVRVYPATPSGPAPTTVELDCSGGLALDIDGRLIPVSIRAERDDVLAGRPVPVSVCGDATVPLGAGDHRVRLAATEFAGPVSVGLTQVALDDAAWLVAVATPGTATVTSWGRTDRHIDVVAEDAALLVIHENFNAGWRAEIDGERLDPVRIDGWQQGFVVPAGSSGTVRLVFGPQRAVTAGFVAGLVGIAVVAGLAVFTGRRGATVSLVERRVPLRVGVLAAAVTVTVLTGPIGLAVMAVVSAVVVPLVGAGSRFTRFAGPGLLLVAGLVAAESPGEIVGASDAPVVQLVSMAAVVVTFVSGLAGSDPER